MPVYLVHVFVRWLWPLEARVMGAEPLYGNMSNYRSNTESLIEDAVVNDNNKFSL